MTCPANWEEGLGPKCYLLQATDPLDGLVKPAFGDSLQTCFSITIKCPIVKKTSCCTDSASLVPKGPIFIEGGNPTQSTTTRFSREDLILEFLNRTGIKVSTVRFDGAQEFGKSLSFQAFCREGGIVTERVALLVLLNKGTCRILEQIPESNLFIDDKGSHLLRGATDGVEQGCAKADPTSHYQFYRIAREVMNRLRKGLVVLECSAEFSQSYLPM